MAAYSGIFDLFGLREWCDESKKKSLMSLRQLKGDDPAWWEIPFPSLDNLHKACAGIPQTRDFTAWLENGFLAIRPALRVVLDPLTQPLSWALDGALTLFTTLPWWCLVPLILVGTMLSSKSLRITAFVGACFAFFLFTDHYGYAVQTLSIIFVCTVLCAILGVPTGILMSKNDTAQRVITPVLDMLQTLPTFVYLIPLIFLFKITEPKLYGLAIILYSIVPVIRLTNLGIRLVDRDVIEAANAYGMTARQKLVRVEFPLALPNIMAGINQTIMMALSMVVIASMIGVKGLGQPVLQAVTNQYFALGLFNGAAVVALAIVFDRVSHSYGSRIQKFRQVGE